MYFGLQVTLIVRDKTPSLVRIKVPIQVPIHKSDGTGTAGTEIAVPLFRVVR
jgi:hypothetical protein